MLNKNIKMTFLVATLSLLNVSPNIMMSAQGATPNLKTVNSPLSIYTAAGASKEQLTQIQTWVDGFTSMQRDRVKKLLGLIQDMRKFSVEPDPNDSSVIAKQTEINAIDNEIALDKVKLSLRIRHLLTPPQRTKLVQLMKQQENGIHMMPKGLVPKLPLSVAPAHAGLAKSGSLNNKQPQ